MTEVSSPPPTNDKSTKREPRERPGRTPPSPRLVGAPTLITFAILFAAHAFAVGYAPIQDCDEVFNFWEPTHYLNHGHGLQTWELSPLYAIRSWLYISIHAIVIATLALPLSLVGISNKTFEFYALRAVLAAAAAACETRLFNKLARCVNPRVAVLFVLIAGTSAGSFIAAASYLPSSFGMLSVTLALADFVDWRRGLRTASGLAWLAVGTIVGWPFIAVLCLPFALEDLTTGLLTGQVFRSAIRMADGLARSLLVLLVEVAVDSLFFRKLSIVPLNIVLYNVFAGPSKGPNIYGTEPWYFYLLNLTLNFNIWFLLALAAMPMLFIYQLVRGQGPTRLGWVRSMVMTSPFYLWLAIMSLQPHKEERFMYPIYPCIALNAAITVHVLAVVLGNSDAKTFVGAIPPQLKFAGLGLTVITATILGIWRSAGLASAYGAPLKVYSHLQSETARALVAGAPRKLSNDTINVCVGKEWYRFPSSYHLPAKSAYRLKFITSEFHGLLPGEFLEDKDGSRTDGQGVFPATWIEPVGMNDENQEDMGKYTHMDSCQFLIDSQFEGVSGSRAEPEFVGMAERAEGDWKVMACEKFLDSGKSGAIGRMGWLPSFVSERTSVPRPFRRAWGRYCLLGRTRRAKAEE